MERKSLFHFKLHQFANRSYGRNRKISRMRLRFLPTTSAAEENIEACVSAEIPQPPIDRPVKSTIFERRTGGVCTPIPSLKHQDHHPAQQKGEQEIRHHTIEPTEKGPSKKAKQDLDSLLQESIQIDDVIECVEPPIVTVRPREEVLYIKEKSTPTPTVHDKDRDEAYERVKSKKGKAKNAGELIRIGFDDQITMLPSSKDFTEKNPRGAANILDEKQKATDILATALDTIQRPVDILASLSTKIPPDVISKKIQQEMSRRLMESRFYAPIKLSREDCKAFICSSKSPLRCTTVKCYAKTLFCVKGMKDIACECFGNTGKCLICIFFSTYIHTHGLEGNEKRSSICPYYTLNIEVDFCEGNCSLIAGCWILQSTADMFEISHYVVSPDHACSGSKCIECAKKDKAYIYPNVPRPTSSSTLNFLVSASLCESVLLSRLSEEEAIRLSLSFPTDTINTLYTKTDGVSVMAPYKFVTRFASGADEDGGWKADCFPFERGTIEMTMRRLTHPIQGHLCVYDGRDVSDYEWLPKGIISDENKGDYKYAWTVAMRIHESYRIYQHILKTFFLPPDYYALDRNSTLQSRLIYPWNTKYDFEIYNEVKHLITNLILAGVDANIPFTITVDRQIEDCDPFDDQFFYANRKMLDATQIHNPHTVFNCMSLPPIGKGLYGVIRLDNVAPAAEQIRTVVPVDPKTETEKEFLKKLAKYRYKSDLGKYNCKQASDRLKGFILFNQTGKKEKKKEKSKEKKPPTRKGGNVKKDDGKNLITKLVGGRNPLMFVLSKAYPAPSSRCVIEEPINSNPHIVPYLMRFFIGSLLGIYGQVVALDFNNRRTIIEQFMVNGMSIDAMKKLIFENTDLFMACCGEYIVHAVKMDPMVSRVLEKRGFSSVKEILCHTADIGRLWMSKYGYWSFKSNFESTYKGSVMDRAAMLIGDDITKVLAKDEKLNDLVESRMDKKKERGSTYDELGLDLATFSEIYMNGKSGCLTALVSKQSVDVNTVLRDTVLDITAMQECFPLNRKYAKHFTERKINILADDLETVLGEEIVTVWPGDIDVSLQFLKERGIKNEYPLGIEHNEQSNFTSSFYLKCRALVMSTGFNLKHLLLFGFTKKSYDLLTSTCKKFKPTKAKFLNILLEMDQYDFGLLRAYLNLVRDVSAIVITNLPAVYATMQLAKFREMHGYGVRYEENAYGTIFVCLSCMSILNSKIEIPNYRKRVCKSHKMGPEHGRYDAFTGSVYCENGSMRTSQRGDRPPISKTLAMARKIRREDPSIDIRKAERMASKAFREKILAKQRSERYQVNQWLERYEKLCCQYIPAIPINLIGRMITLEGDSYFLCPLCCCVTMHGGIGYSWTDIICCGFCGITYLEVKAKEIMGQNIEVEDPHFGLMKCTMCGIPSKNFKEFDLFDGSRIRTGRLCEVCSNFHELDLSSSDPIMLSDIKKK